MTPTDPSVPSVCDAPGCDRTVYARQHCERHYRQLLRRAVLSPERQESLACSASPCPRTAVTRGWCHAHYLRWVRTGDSRPHDPLQEPGHPRCGVDACGQPNHARGFCRTHLSRVDSLGSPEANSPVRSPGAQGSISHGYRSVVVPKQLRHLTEGATRGLEHRLVMAIVLDRPLAAHEVVHHRNGDRLDNRPSNLELWSTSQPKGQRVEDKVAWALELLTFYAPLTTTLSSD